MPTRHHLRSHRSEWALAAVAVVVVLVLAALLFLRDGDDGDGGSAATDDETAGERATDRARDDRRRDRDRRDAGTDDQEEDVPDWLTGVSLDSSAVSDGPHRAVLTVTTASGELIGVKYAFRTPDGFREGQTTSSGSWRDEATVRGTEPLAGVIAQVASGTVTCTATIDGRVTSTRTSSGSFATVVCAG